ncbi:Protein pim1 [Penicillium diatomitis]|uniref:Protein pim1 n=1 Tax=Penicillium diatomitis TaxID=2819901 RepID=A0A9X0BSC4_9EURO|nr:Protein pim1 [Penicillium diatomitis]KAJ5480980.1 Protein pim1 [Penicillium diatomitis]
MAPKKNAEAGPSKATNKAATAKATGRGRPKKTDAAPAAPAAKVTKTAATKVTTKVTKSTKASAPAAKPTKTPAATTTKGKGKAAATTTATTKTKKATTTASASKKRKAEDDNDEDVSPAEEDKTRQIKKPRVVREPKPKVVKPKRVLPKVVINDVPKARLNVFVCGEGSSGELGLGAAKNAIDVKRPRLNKLLDAEEVGVVQIAVGGMHCVALTHDNKILTWGVNDQGALGRDTAWDGGYKEMKEDAESGSDSDDSDDDSGLNPNESTPTAIPSSSFPEESVFVAVAAADSASFALTDDGQVFGWGTFRSNDGVLGFDPEHRIQTTPILIPGLKKIKQLACGANHVLALTDRGAVLSWGSGQQSQLGRRIVERNKLHGLQPREFGLRKDIVHIGSGSYHSFAVHANGTVYAWGLNSFGATAIRDNAGEDEAVVNHPTRVESLSNQKITQLCGGAHHSIARTEDGKCLVWGRTDGHQSGIKVDSLPDDSTIKDDRDRPRILIEPTQVPGIEAAVVAAASDHSLAIDVNGRAWSWGFSATYQTGQGTSDDIEVATMIDNTATRDRKLNWAGAGGQFSVFTDLA